MAASNEPTDVADRVLGSEYFAPPRSIDSLPHTLRWGLVAVGLCGLASFLSTLTLFSILFYQLVTWRKHYKTFLGYNQYVVLFINLLFADLCQASAFVVSWYWFFKNAILAPTASCATQGFLIQFGDVASAFFVLAIAVHTFFTAARGKRIAYSTFNLAIWLTWVCAFFLTALGLGVHKQTYFVRTFAWCWVSDKYQAERLGLHYVWLFSSMLGLLVLYLVTFFTLRRKTSRLFADHRSPNGELANKTSVDQVNRITKLMMLYPLVYVLLTLPISACRMWDMAHNDESFGDITQLVVGALLASCGWVDCLLYSLTRKRLIRETMGRGHSCSHGSRCRSHSEHDSAVLNSVMRRTSITIQTDDFDTSNGRRMPPPFVHSEITSTSGTGPRRSRSQRRDERMMSDPVYAYERSASPQRFVNAGFSHPEEATKAKKAPETRARKSVPKVQTAEVHEPISGKGLDVTMNPVQVTPPATIKPMSSSVAEQTPDMGSNDPTAQPRLAAADASMRFASRSEDNIQGETTEISDSSRKRYYEVMEPAQ